MIYIDLSIKITSVSFFQGFINNIITTTGNISGNNITATGIINGGNLSVVSASFSGNFTSTARISVFSKTKQGRARF